MPLHTSEESHSNLDDIEIDDSHRFIIFSLASSLYGVRLLDVREVVEQQTIKPVPNSIASFRGVCNLRGQIIGVLCLRLRFQLPEAEGIRPVLLVFETDSGAFAAEIDEILSVTAISPDEIESHAPIAVSVPSKHISGIGKSEGRLITLLDLKSILSTEELTQIQNSKVLPKA